MMDMPQPASPRHHMLPTLLVGVAGFVAIVLTACSTTGADPSVPDETGSRAPSASRAAGSSSAPSAEAPWAVPADVLDPLLDDAASRTGSPRESITVAEAEAVTWPTGALGCPAPGMMYTQALVDGWQVILLAGETRIDYRATGPGQFRVCEGSIGG